jgi:hypothetical protein
VPGGQPVSMFDLNGNCRLSGRIAEGGPREGHETLCVDRAAGRRLKPRRGPRARIIL